MDRELKKTLAGTALKDDLGSTGIAEKRGGDFSQKLGTTDKGGFETGAIPSNVVVVVQLAAQNRQRESRIVLIGAVRDKTVDGGCR